MATVPKSSALTVEVCARSKPMVGVTTCRQYVIDATTPGQQSNLEIETPVIEGRPQMTMVVTYRNPQGLSQRDATGVYVIKVANPEGSEKGAGKSVARYEGHLPSGVPISAIYQYDDITVKLTRL